MQWTGADYSLHINGRSLRLVKFFAADRPGETFHFEYNGLLEESVLIHL